MDGKVSLSHLGSATPQLLTLELHIQQRVINRLCLPHLGEFHLLFPLQKLWRKRSGRVLCKCKVERGDAAAAKVQHRSDQSPPPPPPPVANKSPGRPPRQLRYLHHETPCGAKASAGAKGAASISVSSSDVGRQGKHDGDKLPQVYDRVPGGNVCRVRCRVLVGLPLGTFTKSTSEQQANAQR